MGEAKGKLSATQKFVEEFPVCFFCGGKRASTTREHMPGIMAQTHQAIKSIT